MTEVMGCNSYAYISSHPFIHMLVPPCWLEGVAVRVYGEDHVARNVGLPLGAECLFDSQRETRTLILKPEGTEFCQHLEEAWKQISPPWRLMRPQST